MTSAAKKIQLQQIQYKPFVSRIDELKLIEEEKLHALSKGAALFQFITTVAGIPGIGKTTLLGKIKEKAVSLGIRSFLISLGKDLSEKKERFYIFKQIADQFFEKQAARKVHEEIAFIHQSDEDRRRKFLNEYSDLLLTFLKQEPLVLMIDDSHRMNEAEREILEGIMERVSRLNRLFFILAGRSDIRWKSFELRRRTFRIALAHFKEAEIADLIIKPKDAKLSARIYELTRGYPLASVQAIEWVGSNLSVSAPEFHHQLMKKENELILSLTDTILSKFILIDIPDKNQRDELEELLKITSPLRRFDNDILCELLKKHKSGEEDIDSIAATRYIREMAAMTNLVTWNSPKMGYSTDVAVRRLLALSMKYKNEQTYLAIHEHMTSFYQTEMETALEKDPSAPQSILYLMEYIYHYISCRLIRNDVQYPISQIESVVLNNFRKYNYRAKNHFYEEFRNDWEVKELSGDDGSRIIEIAKKHL